MYRKTQDLKVNHNILLESLWIFVFLLPILTIILSFILQHWDWGLMDDVTILNSGSGIVSRFWSYFKATLQFGQFKPLFPLHVSIFYSIFEEHPDWLYIARVFEICFILFIWGWATYRITKKTLSIFLLPAITLSFHYFYDAFFYLSSHEIVGLLFVGIALNCFLNNLEHILGVDFSTPQRGNNLLSLRSWLAGLFFLLFGFASKEPFVSCGIAFGLYYLCLAWKFRRTIQFRYLLKLGIILITLSLIYGSILLFVVRSNYTSAYTLSVQKFLASFKSWFKKDFFNHLPWIIGGSIILWLGARRKGIKAFKIFSLKIKWAALLGILLYGGYVLVLLPWNTIAYYATPLGLFFAFIVVLLISDYLPKVNLRLQILGVICALIFNQLICQYALVRESTYQYDTYNLMEWIRTNYLFRKHGYNFNVQSNAMEPAVAIPALINRKWNLNIKRFTWSLDPNHISEQRCDFYLYSPRFHSIDTSKFKDWPIVFLSKNWVMYQRPPDTE